jgi:hypothetical protein
MIAHRFLAEILSWLSIAWMGKAIVSHLFRLAPATLLGPGNKPDPTQVRDGLHPESNGFVLPSKPFFAATSGSPAKAEDGLCEFNRRWSARFERIRCERIKDLKPFAF